MFNKVVNMILFLTWKHKPSPIDPYFLGEIRKLLIS